MNTELALSQDFKTIIKERILSTLVGLIPDDQLEKLVEAEIQAFFYTEQLLVVEPTKVRVKNHHYNPRDSYSKSDIEVQALAFGSKMTPFRQLVWTVLHEYLQPKVNAVIVASESEAKAELDKWFQEQTTPQIGATYKTLFQNPTTAMSSNMMTRAFQHAATSSTEQLREAFRRVGMNAAAVPEPFIQPKF